MRKVVLCLVAMMLVGGLANAATINVPGDYPTIQQAINAASAGDTVLVADGVYPELVTMNKALTLTSVNGPANCIVDGQGVRRCLVMATGGTGMVINGITFANGYLASGNGGAVVLNQGGNPLFSNNVVRDSRANAYNACIGGGIYTAWTQLHVLNCEVYGNYSGGWGGGFGKQGGAAMCVEASKFYNNKAATEGGGLGFESYYDLSVNNLIVGNQADSRAGGIVARGGDNLYMVNDTCMDNLGYWAGGASSTGGGNLRCWESIVYGNNSPGWGGWYDLTRDTGNYTEGLRCLIGVPNNCNLISGCITGRPAADPLVVASPGWAVWPAWPGGAWDYHLTAASPAVDYPANNQGGTWGGWIVWDNNDDHDGLARDALKDLGCYEYGAAPPSVAVATCPAYTYEGNTLFNGAALAVDGSGSTASTYLWTQTGGVDVSVTGATTAVVPFTAPAWDGSTELTVAQATLDFLLSVDGGADTDTCSCYVRIPGDSNGDNTVNAFDVAAVRTLQPGADFNGDGTVNAFDLSILRINSARSR